MDGTVSHDFNHEIRLQRRMTIQSINYNDALMNPMSSDPGYDAICKAKNQAESGNPEGAVNTLENYLKTDPHNVKVRLLLANVIFYNLDDVEYGKLQLDAILDLEPDNVDAMKAYVTVMQKYKKYNDETEAMFERLLEIAPSAELYSMYASFLRKQIVDFEKSAEYYKKAIELSPNKYEYHQNYAVLLLNDLRDYQTAKTELEILMDMKPGDINIRKNYDKLMNKKFDKNGNLKKPLFKISRR